MPTWFDLKLRPAEESWRSLRQRRATTPAPASSTDKAATFRAALEQAEQQLRAAASVGYDSRALNLFYGLSQGGRALAAAAPGLGQQEWRLNGHGLMSPRGDAGVEVTAVRVRPTPTAATSSFVRLSKVLNSPLTEEVTLGELWPLMYETTFAAPLGEVSFPPLEVERGIQRGASNFYLARDTATVAVGRTVVSIPIAERVPLEEFHRRYPALAGSTLVAHADALPPIKARTWVQDDPTFYLYWPESRDIRNQPGHVLDERLTTYRGVRLAYPVAPGREKTLHPLMVWWQVLYALSMLTRYEPARWTKMIDVDSSTHAVAIEYVLDTALAAVPDLLDEALGSLIRR